MQDSAIRTWLIDQSFPAKKQAADVMATLGGVQATYYRDAGKYKLRWRAPKSAFTAAEWAWFASTARSSSTPRPPTTGPT